MKFFESPRMVTAVVFFLETILALFKIEYFLILPFEQILISLILLSLLPFGFHALYSYILKEFSDGEKKGLLQDSVEEKREPVLEELPEEPVEADETTEQQNEETATEKEEEVPERKIQIVTTDDVYVEEEHSSETTEVESLEPITTKRANRTRMERKRKTLPKREL